jgi:hypothetical protein
MRAIAEGEGEGEGEGRGRGVCAGVMGMLLVLYWGIEKCNKKGRKRGKV